MISLPKRFLVFSTVTSDNREYFMELIMITLQQSLSTPGLCIQFNSANINSYSRNVSLSILH